MGLEKGLKMANPGPKTYLHFNQDILEEQRQNMIPFWYTAISVLEQSYPG